MIISMEPSKSGKLTLAVVGAGAVLGAGVALGVSGIYMYHKLHTDVKLEINNLSNTIGVLVREIEELKSLKLKKKLKSKSEQSQSVFTFAGTASSGEEELFDFTDEENQPFGVNTTLSITEICNEADRLLDENSDEKEYAYRLLFREYEKFSGDAEFLWRLTKATHLQSVNFRLMGNIEEQKKFSLQAKEFGTKALEADDENPEVHKWYAIALGSAGEFSSMQERIQNGFTFQEHVRKAIQLSPNDSTLHHMLGRWCYEVYMLSWIERKVAAALFEAPPEATAQEARNHFFMAEETHHCPSKENKLFIAKTYIGAAEYAEAIPWLDDAFSLPIQCDEDAVAHTEIESLRSKYQGFRTYPN